MADERMTADVPVADKTWYTVREAAAYLGVSQPTIFRWMKAGILSSYKVGGSTRFSREGLDAAVTKRTSKQEAQTVKKQCAACGHANLVNGSLQATGKLYFRPEKARFWTLSEALVGTTAMVCEACGFVQVHADTEKLKKLMPEEAAKS